jgi:hypothetical protein
MEDWNEFSEWVKCQPQPQAVGAARTAAADLVELTVGQVQALAASHYALPPASARS